MRSGSLRSSRAGRVAMSLGLLVALIVIGAGVVRARRVIPGPAQRASTPWPTTAPSTPCQQPAEASVLTHGPRDRPRIALTFDADMTRGMLAQLRSGRVAGWYDAAIIDELRQTGTPATIFLTGLWAQTYPGVVQSLAADPLFELANHSMDHDAWQPGCFNLPPIPASETKVAEVQSAALSIRGVSGILPHYFRFPGGCHSAADVSVVAGLGEQAVGWDVSSDDAFQPSSAVVVRAVLGAVQPGSIVVMHLMGAPNAPATAAALRVLIPILKQRGFEFVTLQVLLDGVPGDSPASRPLRGPPTFKNPS